MLTLEQINAFFATEEGKKVHQQVITDYIQNNEGGKELLDSVMAPELVKAKSDAVKEWETTGKGKNLKEHNTKLLAEIASGKPVNDELQKFKNLLDISGYTDYNELENAVLSIKKDGVPANDEIVNLKKEFSKLQIRSRELEIESKKYLEERDSLKTAVQDSDSYIADSLIKNEIKSALLKEGFDENQAQGLVYRVSQLGNFKVEKDPLTGDRKAVNDYGLSPEVYTMKEYLVTDEGKAFKPNRAGGGGALGDLNSGGQKNKKFSELTWGERAQMQKTDPVAYKTLKEKSRLV